VAKLRDLTGQVFGRLRVLEHSGRNAHGDNLWCCRCTCGADTVVKATNLLRGLTKSCGCLATGLVRRDATGERYHRLTVVEYLGRDSHRTSIYRCVCDCGTEVRANINHLRRGKIKSCGCLKREADTSRHGPRNPNYNPLLSVQEREEGRNIPGYDEWAQAVKARDGYRCRLCRSAASGYLTSHHLDSYRSSAEGRIQVENGVCLCVICHAFFHKVYGYGGNTADQFAAMTDWFRQHERRRQAE
jgi:hypothetical protein